MIVTASFMWHRIVARAYFHDSLLVIATSLQTGPISQLIERVIDLVLALDMATVELVVALRHPALTKFMSSVTGLGSAAAAVVLLGLVYLAGWKRDFIVSAVALSIAGIVVVSLMATVQRAFPPHPVCLTTGAEMPPHSFPSGHAAAVTIYALAARDSEHLPVTIVTILAAVIATSRIYLGTHFLSDTIAGILIGVGAFVIATALSDRLNNHDLSPIVDRLPITD